MRRACHQEKEKLACLLPLAQQLLRRLRDFRRGRGCVGIRWRRGFHSYQGAGRILESSSEGHLGLVFSLSASETTAASPSRWARAMHRKRRGQRQASAHEPSAKQIASAEEPALHGSDRPLQQLGNLLVGLALEIGQDNRQTIFFGKSIDFVMKHRLKIVQGDFFSCSGKVASAPKTAPCPSWSRRLAVLARARIAMR